jgi:hypothetical protein
MVVLRRVMLALESVVALAVASLRLAVTPKDRTSHLLGVPGAAGRVPRELTADGLTAARVGQSVERVANLVPWLPTCLPRALAARAMLRRRHIPCELHLGVRPEPAVEAHAWVTVGLEVVVGAPITGLTELARFTSPAA